METKAATKQVRRNRRQFKQGRSVRYTRRCVFSLRVASSWFRSSTDLFGIRPQEDETLSDFPNPAPGAMGSVDETVPPGALGKPAALTAALPRLRLLALSGRRSLRGRVQNGRRHGPNSSVRARRASCFSSRPLRGHNLPAPPACGRAASGPLPRRNPRRRTSLGRARVPFEKPKASPDSRRRGSSTRPGWSRNRTAPATG